MPFTHLLTDTRDGILTLTLNRPEVYNALNPTLLHELAEAFTAAADDDSVRVVVLTGAGDRAFSSGADLKAGFTEGLQDPGESLRTTYHPLVHAMRNLPKPILGRLNGIAAGAGCSLALACDVLVASETAAMSQLFIGIGLVPDAGSTFFLPRRIGYAAAFELCSTGRTVPAAECLALGLVNEVVPAADLDAAVQRRAAAYAQAPTQSIGLLKKLLQDSLSNTLDEQLEREAAAQTHAARSADAAEGVLAFLQKRKPVFRGH